MACVLIVEDDGDTRNAIADVLGLDGHAVRVAADGADAIWQLTHDDLPSVILVDSWMPHVSGPELLTWLSEHPRFNDVPVIVVSGDHRQTGHPRVALTLLKPFNADDLLAAVRKYCGQRSR